MGSHGRFSVGETQCDLLCMVIILAHCVHDMLMSRVKARRAPREGTTANVDLELILAYAKVGSSGRTRGDWT